MAQGDGRLVGGAAEAEAPTVAARLVWVDNLKITVIAGVIVVHTATAYLLDAFDWYYDTERTTSQLWEPLLGLPALLSAVFGLGPLFLLGGGSRPPRSRARAPAGSPLAGYCASACRWWRSLRSSTP